MDEYISSNAVLREYFHELMLLIPLSVDISLVDKKRIRFAFSNAHFCDLFIKKLNLKQDVQDAIIAVDNNSFPVPAVQLNDGSFSVADEGIKSDLLKWLDKPESILSWEFNSVLKWMQALPRKASIHLYPLIELHQNAEMIHELTVSKTGIFYKLPNELLVKIAGLTINKELTSKEIEEEIDSYFNNDAMKRGVRT